MRRFFIFTFAFILLFNLFARDETILDSGWKFKLGEAGDAQKNNFNSALWPAVVLPHCWGWEDAQAGKDYYQGPGWYRRDLGIGKPEPGKRYFLKFEAASSVADVYVNGKLLGEHRGAFGAFTYEITGALNTNGGNLLAVRVSNAPQPDIAPLSGDFPLYGGLYRPVHLIVTEAQDIALTDHGSPGMAWFQTSISETQAVLDVNVEISNGASKSHSLKLIATVYDANNFRVAGSEMTIVPVPAMMSPYSLRVVVPHPHLWNGRADPYLYNAVVELRSANDVLDSVEEPLGLRYYSVDPNKGFFLNGKYLRLHGVDRHQDRPDKGWAISEADQDEDISLMKEMGVNVVRCAHYQHSDYFYSLCDRAGILVWAEIPQVNEIHATPEFENTSRNQLIDLIRQNLNHPAIFVWSLFNEIRGGTDDPHRELQDLKIVANGEDPTRPTIAATCVETFPQMNKIPDLLGWNIYPGWYSGWGTKDDFGLSLDQRRADSRHGGICVSEYGAGANIAEHEDNPKQPVTTSQWHPEEWQAILHESAWAAIKARPFVWGSFVWCMFDFAVSTRHEGGIPGRNDKGLVTYDRQTKKDAFYFYKANWSDEPTVYITSRRFTERTNAVTNVKIYANAAPVELLLNGVSLGKQTQGTNCVFVWPNVTLRPGENKIEARAENDGTNLTDSCVWTLK